MKDYLNIPLFPTTAYIGIGSNLGDRHRNCLDAVFRIHRIPDCRVTGVSEWFHTRPIGVEDQDWYINGAVSVKTKMPAQDLLRHLMAIEKDMGRVRVERWGPRTLDLDILLFGEEIIDEANLKVPHPRMHLRRFVLVPMAELAPGLVHPALGVSISQLLEGLPVDGQEVVGIKDGKQGTGE